MAIAIPRNNMTVGFKRTACIEGMPLKSIRNGLTFDFAYEYGFSGKQLQFLLDMQFKACHGTAASRRNIAQGGLDIDNSTASKQMPLKCSNGLFYLEPATDDYGYQEIIDDQTGVTSHRLATVATGARYLGVGVDWSLYATESGNRAYRAVFHSTGQTAWGYIGGVDSAEAFGGEKINDPGFDTACGTGNWTCQAGWSIAGSKASFADLGTVYMRNDITTTAGKLYRFQFTVANGGGNAKLLLTVGGAALFPSAVYPDGLNTKYFTSPGGSAVYIYGDTAGGTFDLTDVSIKEVTSFGTIGVKLYNSVSGGAQSLVGNTGIDPNAITSVEVYKVIGSGITGDHSFLKAVMLDDGQPASDEVMWGNSDYTNGIYSLGVKVKTTGKLESVVSSDGSTAEGQITDAAAFANGAMATYALIGGVYDLSGPTYAFYKNGSVLASSNLGAGGPGASVYDTYFPITLAASAEASAFLNGRDALFMLFNRTVSSGENKRAHLTLKKRRLPYGF